MSTYTALDEMSELDFDIVQISSHNTTTPVCQKYEGKIFSLRGQTPGLPILDVTPPFHPNCLHILLPRKDLNIETAKKVNARVDKNFKNIQKDLTNSQKAGINKQEDYIRKNRPLP
jgi:hypothetical protein